MPKSCYLRINYSFPAVILFFLFFLSAFFSAAQMKTISGVVTNESGNALPAITVTVKKINTATVTNEKGFYTINATIGAMLVFSSANTEIDTVVVGEQTEYNVTLRQKITTLNDVVIVGYGRQKKVNLVGSVATVNVDEKITGRPLPNISAALSGLVPGLSATQSTGMAGRNGAALLIRGLGTPNNSAPLIVVDGIPDVDINRVNVNDIETVSVLKDASSASVYGSRAGNGVILISTRTGKGMNKTLFAFNGN